jgi:hypothetical protein
MYPSINLHQQLLQSIVMGYLKAAQNGLHYSCPAS